MARPITFVLSATLGVAALGCIEFGGPLIGEAGGEGDEQAEGETETGETADTSDTEDTGEDRCGPSTGTVDHVVDGDTIVLDSGERVRYILVNTPEITGDKNECWGTQASEHNAALVLGETLSLTYDVECEDQYGRLLAYVSVGELEVNRELLETGQACLLHIPPNGNAKVAEYQALEDAAKQAGLGMWGACGTIKCD